MSSGFLAQLDMFAAPSELQPPAPKKKKKPQFGLNQMYCRLSALQKCIRRGLEAPALANADWLFRNQPYALATRLRVICFEDVGLAGLDLALEVAEETLQRPPWSFYEDAVRRLVASPCNRDTDCGANLIYKYGDRTTGIEELPDQVELTYYHEHEKRIHAKDLWPELVADAEELGILGPVERLRKLRPKTTQHVNRVAFLLVHRTRAGTIGEVRLSKKEIQTPWLVDGQLPLCAIDIHTRAGKMAISATIRGTRFEDRRDHIGSRLFFAEGTMLAFKASWPNDYRAAANAVICGPWIEGEREVLAQLGRHRRWAYQKLQQEDEAKMRLAAAKGGE